MPINLRKPKPAADADGTPEALEQTLLEQAIRELGIDRPIITTRLVGSRLEIMLYGGDLVHWPAKPRR